MMSQQPRISQTRAVGDPGASSSWAIRRIRAATLGLFGQRIGLSAGTASRHKSKRRRADRANAAVEFAVAAPLLTILLGGASDFGVAQFYRTSLANAVSAGTQYAFMTGTSVTATN